MWSSERIGHWQQNDPHRELLYESETCPRLNLSTYPYSLSTRLLLRRCKIWVTCFRCTSAAFDAIIRWLIVEHTVCLVAPFVGTFISSVHE